MPFPDGRPFAVAVIGSATDPQPGSFTDTPVENRPDTNPAGAVRWKSLWWVVASRALVVAGPGHATGALAGQTGANGALAQPPPTLHPESAGQHVSGHSTGFAAGQVRGAG